MSGARPLPWFSVVIATRNRTLLLQRALASVLGQTGVALEVIVVDDGSTGSDADAGRALEASSPPLVRWLRLPHRAHGHGPAFARNTGAALAAGRYLCFLDDDDLWTDPGHLQRCLDSLALQASAVDLYFGHQEALHVDGRLHGGPLWLQGLEQHVAGARDAGGSVRVSADALLRAPGFAHLNCTIIRRSLFNDIGGFDEALRYEEDRDLYFRAIDRAQCMLYNPASVARHHIPAPGAHANASTLDGLSQRRLHQLRICDKVIISARLAGLRQHGRMAKSHALKHLADELWAEGRREEALSYMREALGVAFTAKWLAYTAVRALQCAVSTHHRP